MVVVPLAVMDVMMTLLGGAPDAEERDERIAEPKVQPEEELRAAGGTAGDIATSTTMICASGDRDGVGDGVIEDDTVRVAMTELVTDGEGATDKDLVCDRETDFEPEAVTLGEAAADTDFIDDRVVEGDRDGDREGDGGNGVDAGVKDGVGVGGVGASVGVGVAGAGGVELDGAPAPKAYTRVSLDPMTMTPSAIAGEETIQPVVV